MRVLIFCAGTDGDCFPVFTLARHLRRRGHDVTAMAPPVYSGIPILDGVGFLPLCTMPEYRQFIADARRLAGRYTLLASRELSVRWNLTAWHAIETLHASDLLVLAPDRPFFWADVAAKLQFGCAAVRFQIQTPRVSNPGVAPSQLPPGRVQQYLASALALRWHEAATEAGLAADCASLSSLSRARPDVPTIALWPEWLVGQRGSEQVEHVRAFGFVLPDRTCQSLSATESDLPTLKDHTVFKRGQADGWPTRAYDAAISGCWKLGMQALFLGGTPPSGELPPGIFWRPFVPLDRCLENARVIVHDGGIGTAAAAIRCGVPQIIVPLWFDQPSNGEWMRRLGVASVIPPGRYTVGALCRQIGRMAADGSSRRRTLELSSRIDSSADSARICEFLESLGAG